MGLLFSMGKEFNYLCRIKIEELYKKQITLYVCQDFIKKKCHFQDSRVEHWTWANFNTLGPEPSEY